MKERRTVYFTNPGEANTRATLQLAADRIGEGDIGKALVATTRGFTGLMAMEILQEVEVIVVTHSYGFSKINQQELTPENREAIEGRGGKILTCQHAFGGIGRAVRKKFNTYELEEIIANSLRTFCEGVKVCLEITLMAADSGIVDYGENIVCIAGSGLGADTALVVKAANAQSFFDLRVQEIICKPVFL